jgi:hypothetical protein
VEALHRKVFEFLHTKYPQFCFFKSANMWTTPEITLFWYSYPRPQRYQNMTHRVKRPSVQWAGVPTGEMCIAAGVSADYLKKLRVCGLLTRGIYWYTLPGSDRIIWIRDLVRDYLVNGNSPAHQRAIEKYLASLPSSSEYKPTVT